MKSYIQKNSKINYSDHWATPKEIYEYYKKRFYKDPCELYSSGFDFHHIDQPIFLNPPYSDISIWIDWAIANHCLSKKHVVILIPSRTDTQYFHRLLEYGCDLEFIKGRLHFNGSKNSAPFPSVIVHLGKEKEYA